MKTKINSGLVPVSRFVYSSHYCVLRNLTCCRTTVELVEFYVPPVPVFVLPGSVSDGVPPSDRCAKQRRSALALQTTSGALTIPVRPARCAAVHTNMVFFRLPAAGISCCCCCWWCCILTSEIHDYIGLNYYWLS